MSREWNRQAWARALLFAPDPERQLWGEQYRRSVSGVYEVAGEIARSVAAEIELELIGKKGRDFYARRDYEQVTAAHCTPPRQSAPPRRGLGCRSRSVKPSACPP